MAILIHSVRKFVFLSYADLDGLTLIILWLQILNVGMSDLGFPNHTKAWCFGVLGLEASCTSQIFAMCSSQPLELACGKLYFCEGWTLVTAVAVKEPRLSLSDKDAVSVS